MQVSTYSPEALKGLGRSSETKLRDVPFKKCSDKIETPLETFFLIRRKVASRKTTPQPESS